MQKDVKKAITENVISKMKANRNKGNGEQIDKKFAQLFCEYDLVALTIYDEIQSKYSEQSAKQMCIYCADENYYENGSALAEHQRIAHEFVPKTSLALDDLIRILKDL